MENDFYIKLLGEIKHRIYNAQIKATVTVNAEMIAMYWDIGELIHQRQQKEGWSAQVIPKLATDLKNELSS